MTFNLAELPTPIMKLRKAFDSVSHDRLLQKAQNIRATGNLYGSDPT